jgi:hypothetical protein
LVQCSSLLPLALLSQVQHTNTVQQPCSTGAWIGTASSACPPHPYSCEEVAVTGRGPVAAPQVVQHKTPHQQHTQDSKLSAPARLTGCSP